MPVETNGTNAPATRADDLAAFDKLPHVVKELLWYCHTPVDSQEVAWTQRRWTLTPDELREEYENKLTDHKRRVILQHYGRDHPEYKEPKE